MQRGDPALGPLAKGCNIRLGQRRASGIGEVGGGFVGGETQVGRADFDKLAADGKGFTGTIRLSVMKTVFKASFLETKSFVTITWFK